MLVVCHRPKSTRPARTASSRLRACALALAACSAAPLALAKAALAQSYGTPAAAPPRLEAEGPWESTIRLEVYDRLRVELVDWFAPAPGSPTPRFRYDFVGNKLQLGLRVTRAPYELFVQFQNTTLGNVPSDAVGVGGTYFMNTMRSTQNGAILRNAWASTQALLGVPGLFVKGGRQLYSDGFDAPAKQPNLRWVQANRISQRLIGPFDYTHVGRSFDGGQIGYASELVRVTGFGFRPTFGGYEVDANRQLDVTLGGLSLDLPDSQQLGSTVGRLFWFVYDDDRDVVFLDNRPLAERQADLGKSATIHTIGANAIHVLELGPGLADAMAYGFGQLGDWQSQDHSAWAYGVELGWQLAGAWSKPWLRVGINSGSGDPDPNDDLHQTFFQLLPTAWLYAQFPFYNMMNNQDVFVQWILEPHPLVNVRLDLHWLRVNSSADLAYFGGGATKNDLFGYGGVPANGRHELAYLVHTMLSLRLSSFVTLNAFYAHAFGQGVIAANFAGRGGDYGFVEAVLAF